MPAMRTLKAVNRLAGCLMAAALIAAGCGGNGGGDKRGAADRPAGTAAAPQPLLTAVPTATGGATGDAAVIPTLGVELPGQPGSGPQGELPGQPGPDQESDPDPQPGQPGPGPQEGEAPGGSASEAPLPVSGGTAAGGWYADPACRNEVRWWDGRQWTEIVGNSETRTDDPLTGDDPAAVPGEALLCPVPPHQGPEL